MIHLQAMMQPASPSKASRRRPQAGAGRRTSIPEHITKEAQVHILAITAAIRLDDLKTTTGTSLELDEASRSESATRSPSTNAWGRWDLKPAMTRAIASTRSRRQASSRRKTSPPIVASDPASGLSNSRRDSRF